MRELLSEKERLQYDRAIMKKVISHEYFQKAENLLIYMNYGSEVSTTGMIDYAFAMGKRVFVPRVSGREMAFYEIHDPKECSPGYMGIPEPPDEAETFLPEKTMCREDTLMILPGLVFDQNGNRIGYGGGFYDRFLAKHPECTKMGIAYDFQCVDRIPPEENDIPADIIVTERRMILPA